MQEQKRKSERAKPANAEAQASAQKNEEAQATSDMLDEIDEVLEVNAAEFVAAYVQKGGQ